MQRDSNKTEQKVPDNVTDKYVLSKLVLFGVYGSNMISGYFIAFCVYGLLQRERE